MYVIGKVWLFGRTSDRLFRASYIQLNNRCITVVTNKRFECIKLSSKRGFVCKLWPLWSSICNHEKRAQLLIYVFWVGISEIIRWEKVGMIIKVGCVFPMVISSEFCMGRYRDDNHREGTSHFNFFSYNFCSSIWFIYKEQMLNVESANESMF